MSDELKVRAKRPAPRRRSVAMEDASSPAPTDIGPVCGHDSMSCSGGTCGVRYVGPTTHIRDHHAVHAARGVSHVWTAAIVSGFAVVLTGAIAFTAVNAQVEAAAAKPAPAADAVMASRLDRLERLVLETRDACKTAAKATGTNQKN